ncbi:lytic transglycosylase domain-containing protein [Blastomonas sp.]|uniref:lytic transglycosylase domain-containing protein n=1 Tax=Blastomonas sp. TaxID=1909299 RepID=UPI00391BB1AA
MSLKKAWMIAAAALAMTTQPALAETSSYSYFSDRVAKTQVPDQLSSAERQYYGEVFAAIRGQDWAKASVLLDSREKGLLHDIARAELYLAANSPRVEMGPLLSLLSAAPELPHAERLATLATKRGATILPDRPMTVKMASFAGVTRRGKPRSISDGTVPVALAALIQERIVADDPAGAALALAQYPDPLSPHARTELQQRVAWSYYIENRDDEALALARVAAGGAGDWVGEAHWTAGLAAWRLGDCVSALQGFEGAAASAWNEELRAAGYYWGSRAATRCRRPDLVQANLRAASQYGETLYGVLAAEQLGMAGPIVRAPDFGDGDWKQLKNRQNVRRAIALGQIGESTLADQVLRHEAQIAGDSSHDALLRLARDLSLPQTQMWLAHNGPQGSRPDSFARFPSPRWVPVDGWRVDPALVYAHTLQESNFRSDARSAADARGLMQVRPGTAQDMARARGQSLDANQLYQPSTNLEYGQRYLEFLRDRPETQGLLPKIIAAYNAGPLPVSRWNDKVKDGGDPLLFIESIPYWETRAYVGIILRNYWMYEKQAGVTSKSAQGLAQGMWPRFPHAGGMELVRVGTVLNN